MTRHACFRSLSLGALALTLLLGSCQGAQKATTAEDKHHLQGTEWCDSTGIFTLHFNSPEDVELSLNYEGSPMGTLTYDIPCHFAGDTIYIDDYSKTTPFGKITILRSFRGIIRGRPSPQASSPRMPRSLLARPSPPSPSYPCRRSSSIRSLRAHTSPARSSNV